MNDLKDKDTIPPERDQSVIGTMRIDPEPYKAAHNRDDIDRTKFAVAGLLYMLRREHSIRNLSLMTLVVLFLIVWLRVEITHSVIVFLTVGLIWVTEALNSAVEAVVDLVTQDLHPMAKVAKDVAASATFVAVVMATITVAVLLGPALLDRLLTLLEMIGLGL